MAQLPYPYENEVPKNALEKMGYGCYPEGYNRKVHGPYNPARYYGPKDTAFGEVKISELSKWIGRRDKSFQSMMQAVSRAHFRWIEKFVAPRKAGVAPALQLVFGLCVFSYLIQWKTLKHHKYHKYHW